MSNTTTAGSGGISTLGLLGLIFATLKLLGYITWSWWWVTAPFWGGLAIIAVLVLAFAIGAAVVAVVGALLGK